ncbi:MAG: response regulator, partial [Myxococcaceae bacterium]
APQLVLTEIMLPGMCGLELCRRLRENPQTAHLPIVLFSARGDVQTRLQAFEAGADDFVNKPFDPRELNARIDALLRRREPAAMG